MAVISYSVKGKADTKPLDKLKAELRKLADDARKMNDVMNKFGVTKAFQMAAKGIGECLKSYDEFFAATGKELPITKQLDNVKTTFAATIGTVRDSLIEAFTGSDSALGEMTGKFQDIADKWIPKIGAGFGAAIHTAKALIDSIVLNFQNLSNAENWQPLFDGIAKGFEILVPAIGELFKALFEVRLPNLWKVWEGLVWQGVNKLGEFIARYILLNSGQADKLKKQAEDWEEYSKKGVKDLFQGSIDDFKTVAGALGGALKEVGAGFLDSVTGGLDIVGTFQSEYNTLEGKIRSNMAAMQAGKQDKPKPDEKGTTTPVAAVFDKLTNTMTRMFKEPETLADKMAARVDALFHGWNSALGDIGASMNSFRDRVSAQKAATQEYENAVIDYNNTLYDLEQARVDATNKIREAHAKGEINAEKYAEELAKINKEFEDGKDKADTNLGNAKKKKDDTVAISGVNPILDILNSIINQVIGAFAQLESVNKVLNAFGTVVGAMVGVLQPLIDNIFGPLGVILESIGRIIGILIAPVLEYVNAILTPIFEVITLILDILEPILAVFSNLIGLFLKLNPILLIFTTALNLVGAVIEAIYDYILVPVVNFFVSIFGKVYNFVVGIWNKIVDFLKSIHIFNWYPFKNMKRAATMDIDAAMLKPIDNSARGGSTEAANNSASYNVQGDIYINLNFHNSYVNGDAEAIAIHLWAEIRRAQSMGKA